MTRHTHWLPAEIAILHEMWAAGSNGAEMALATGHSKNSVFNRAAVSQLPPRRFPRPVPAAYGTVLAAAHWDYTPPLIAPTRDCQFPISTVGRVHTMCGLPSTTKSYCGLHHAVSYYPITRRTTGVEASA